MAEEFGVLPDRKYFKIGEASNLLGVKPHVLRYWETEFPQIRPYKSRSGQRLYRRRDVEALQHIQKLLHQERYTIAGARQALRLLCENDSQVIDEPSLSDDAIEAAVAEEVADHQIADAVSAPDILEVVEKKMAHVAQMKVASQIIERLEMAKAHLQEMILMLDADAK